MQTLKEVKEKAIADVNYMEGELLKCNHVLTGGEFWVTTLINNVVAAVKHENKTPKKVPAGRFQPGPRGGRGNKTARRSA
jgi:hypothetical protein